MICYQSYAQEDPWGDELEDVIICSEPDDITVNDYGSYTITETCVHGNIDGIATNDCEWNCSTVVADKPDDGSGDNDEPDCNGDLGGSAYMASCGCIGGSTGIYSCDSNPDDPGPGDSGDPCGNQIVCPNGQQLNYTTCNCECTRTSCPTGYRLVNCECVKISTPPDPDPCTAASIAAGVSVSNFFTNSVLQQANNFSPFTFNQGQNEEWFMITNNNGVITPGPIVTLSPNGGTVQIASNAVADAHIHTDQGPARPSAEDLYELGKTREFANNFTDSYILAYDETKYALHISDANLLATFMSTNGNFYDPLTKEFLQTSNLYISFNNAYTSLMTNDPNMYISEAQERAYAFILKGSGVDLLVARPGTNTFKKIDILPAKNPDGTAMKDSNGQPIYKKADCN
ncbi:hypothetical protein AAEO57_20435 [Flavobacterium sp. DGU38]|uniref:Metal-binding motif-containing protein n=1 Tax=Flavobacterium calami TaxID=3139144 RepID=A0ABU9IVM9_9FLAO